MLDDRKNIEHTQSEQNLLCTLTREFVKMTPMYCMNSVAPSNTAALRPAAASGAADGAALSTVPQYNTEFIKK